MSNFDFQLDRPNVIENFKTKSENDAEIVKKRLIEYLIYANIALRFEPTNNKVLALVNSIDEEIYKIEKGSDGEKELMYYLENSYIPMYVLPDVTLSNNKDGQCDFIVITRYNIYVLECKNWNCKYLNVDEKGQFSICYRKGDKYENKNIISPYQRNKNHTKLLNQILNKKYDFNFNSEEIIKSALVFTNKKMNFNINNDIVKSETMYADVLPLYIETLDKNSINQPMSDSQMKQIVDTISQCSLENDHDYLKKFKWIKPYVIKKLLFNIISFLLIICSTLIYGYYFIKYQSPKLMQGSPTKDLGEMAKILFMMFYPLGIVSGINGLIIGSCKKKSPRIYILGSLLQILITVFTITWMIKIDNPVSTLKFIVTVIVLIIICILWNIPAIIFSKIGEEISDSIHREKL